ncbi:hypothetical protein [Tenacibaculum sp. 190524A02b]|uniref:hypothetical protein n=1 Tax=Tenacibaculum vairaonense TaxID=3137860 RepID=UPI0031FB3D79
MKQNKNIWYLIGLLLVGIVLYFWLSKSKEGEKIIKEVAKDVKEDLTIDKYVTQNINLGESSVPSGPAKDATKKELYKVAWQQFIALNWPVKTSPSIKGNRGKPSTASGQTFLNVTPTNTPDLVWNTYASKAELFGPKYLKKNALPKWEDLGVPDYSYATPIKQKGTSSFTLFNNLDENNEIGEATVFGGGGLGNTSGGNQVLYEAKMNEVEYSYIRKNNLQNTSIIDTWVKNTKNDLNTYGGTCLTDEAAKKSIVCFPCADTKESKEGAIEIKAAWRKLKEHEHSSRYYTKDVILYEKNAAGAFEYTNEKYALVALHIIRKTKEFPTFIFTTFNHVDNIKNGIYYNNAVALQYSKPPYYQYYKDTTYIEKGKTVTKSVPDTTSYPKHKFIKQGNIAVHSQEEIHTIPQELQDFNSAVQGLINTKNSKSVWQYYELLGVQATPVDYTNKTSDPSYYLANDVVETDYTLRRFTGSFANPTGIKLGTQNVNTKGETVSMGGCKGCHGNAQKGGTDFSFLLQTNDLKPAPISPSQTDIENVQAIVNTMK